MYFEMSHPLYLSLAPPAATPLHHPLSSCAAPLLPTSFFRILRSMALLAGRSQGLPSCIFRSTGSVTHTWHRHRIEEVEPPSVRPPLEVAHPAFPWRLTALCPAMVSWLAPKVGRAVAYLCNAVSTLRMSDEQASGRARLVGCKASLANGGMQVLSPGDESLDPSILLLIPYCYCSIPCLYAGEHNHGMI